MYIVSSIKEEEEEEEEEEEASRTMLGNLKTASSFYSFRDMTHFVLTNVVRG